MEEGNDERSGVRDEYGQVRGKPRYRRIKELRS
jgi:hypothetical protein